MELKTKCKSWPAWFCGGILGLLFYMGVAVLNLAFWMHWSSADNPNAVPHVTAFFGPFFMAVSFYPGILFSGSYEALGTIIPLNLAFYFAAGAMLGLISAKLKK